MQVAMLCHSVCLDIETKRKVRIRKAFLYSRAKPRQQRHIERDDWHPGEPASNCMFHDNLVALFDPRRLNHERSLNKSY